MSLRLWKKQRERKQHVDFGKLGYEFESVSPVVSRWSSLVSTCVEITERKRGLQILDSSSFHFPPRLETTEAAADWSSSKWHPLMWQPPFGQGVLGPLALAAAPVTALSLLIPETLVPEYLTALIFSKELRVVSSSFFTLLPFNHLAGSSVDPQLAPGRRDLGCLPLSGLHSETGVRVR